MPFGNLTPSINIISSGSRSDSHPQSQLHRNTSLPQNHGVSVPMAIPNAREIAPPPLPPPRDLNFQNGQDLGFQWSNRNSREEPERQVKPGSSLMGGSFPRKPYRDYPEPAQPKYEGSSWPTQKLPSMPVDPELQGSESWDSQEDRKGSTRPSLAAMRLHSSSQLGRRAMVSSTEAYDKQLLSKIGGPKSPGRPSGANQPSSQGEPSQSPQDSGNRYRPQIKPLAVPEHHKYPPLGSPSSAGYPHSALSPRAGIRSPLSDHGLAEGSFSSRYAGGAMGDAHDHGSISSRSHRNSMDHGVFDNLDPELAEENGLRELDINDHSPSASEDSHMGNKGTKRRASSPPSDGPREDRALGAPNDLYHRRSVLAHRTHSARANPAHGSLSSMGSSVGPRNSYASNASWNTMASSVTSYGGERLSPSMLSPAAETAELGQQGHGPASPYPASLHRVLSRPSQLPHQHHNHNHTQHQPQPQLHTQLPHQHIPHPHPHSHPHPHPHPHSHSHLHPQTADSPVSVHNGSPLDHPSPQPIRTGTSKMPGFYVCDCCPKKPKKFESKKELEAHTNEKQFQCQYCPNRFKNKNEAERHQNSLHLRKHSWSCSALPSPHAAFHPSPAHPTTIDICGYCGQEFSNPPNWDVRGQHLCQLHKFGECNQAKKFFRADHFRQHLKHSHAGTSGKWTNMLEAACMKEEAPPIPRSALAGPSGTNLSVSVGPYYINPSSPTGMTSGSASLSNIMNDPEP